MRKLLVSILLTLVVGFGAFAKQYLVLADEESTQPSYRDYESIMEEMTGLYEKTMENYTKQEQENFTHIVVYDKLGPLYDIWVCEKPKNGIQRPFNIVVLDGCARYKATYRCYTTDKNPDPVQIGLTFVKTRAFLIINVTEDTIEFEAELYEKAGEDK